MKSKRKPNSPGLEFLSSSTSTFCNLTHLHNIHNYPWLSSTSALASSHVPPQQLPLVFRFHFLQFDSTHRAIPGARRILTIGSTKICDTNFFVSYTSYLISQQLSLAKRMIIQQNFAIATTHAFQPLSSEKERGTMTLVRKLIFLSAFGYRCMLNGRFIFSTLRIFRLAGTSCWRIDSRVGFRGSSLGCA
jgi:hypothetical protein